MSISRIVHSCLVTLTIGLMPLSSGPAASEERLDIVATTGMVADTLHQIGGDHISIRNLMGPGVDPHLYRQTRSDIAAMTRADAIFWNGLYLEAQLEEFLFRLSEHRPVFALGEAVPEDQRLSHEDYSDQYDPHIWMDPQRWRYVAEAARDALIELDPEHREDYQANAEDFLTQLDRLDEYARKTLSSVPESSQILVTAHDAFGYLGDAYGYDVLGIQGFSTESEAGLARIENLVDLLVERQISAIFIESSVPRRNIEALIEGAASQGHDVSVGGELFSDAMGPAGTYEGTYIGMIDHNVTYITRALGGEAPAHGLNAKLADDAEDNQ
ncbi:manganese/zinc/iron transport system substrate-binding protein [Aidingimonas halophila]|uniref:Manganese/zinc/iron transport system substrate-binding protein n=2 Tax=Aidingimonas halophila TaxID=574349 RepID=A0A1H3F155_9GAMM|nr:manganese/zinc/iron transport system substrate-binding protein [Aidingimonas halophila]